VTVAPMPDYHVENRSVDRAGRGLVVELNHGIRDPAPDYRAVLIAGGGELVGAHPRFPQAPCRRTA
jgi:hypothetical protein